MERKCHFSGYATRNDLLCGDGRTIRKNAFKGCDGIQVPLIWNHDHKDPNAVLGHAILENRDDGVYAYCTFNDEPQGRNAHGLVKHGDVRSLSIWANQLKQIGGDVIHGVIRELSLVLAGANPGAYIDFVMAHGEEGEDGLYANYDENALVIYHSADSETETTTTEEVTEEETVSETEEVPATVEELQHSEEDKPTEKENEGENSDDKKDGKTFKEVFDSMNEEQKTLFYGVIGGLLAEDDDKEKTDDKDETKEVKHNESEGGNETMKQNVFEKKTDVQTENTVLSHADQEAILELAKTPGVGSFKHAMKMYADENSLSHGFEEAAIKDYLFPEYKNLTPGAPELIRQDQSWVMKVINKITKSPFSRIKTRHADARIAELRAKGYQKKGDQKTISAQIKMLGRTTDPQTVYRKDELHRDDIVDITDFDIVGYQWGVMKDNYYEEIALAALVGDRRDDGDPDKIHEDHIRSIMNDDELYTIHKDVDMEAARAELQGTNTVANFSENYIYAEAMIMAALYSREQFKGSGTPAYYCAPHSVNVMLLARDLNGRRIYDSKADLAKALNVSEIVEIEQLEGVTRTTETGDVKKLHGIFVNLADYTFGATKGGELTKFEDFDIDFNKYKYLLEGRLSGALTKPFSAIVLEEPVSAEG